jgi:hypothetical protein
LGVDEELMHFEIGHEKSRELLASKKLVGA